MKKKNCKDCLHLHICKIVDEVVRYNMNMKKYGFKDLSYSKVANKCEFFLLEVEE